VLFQVKASLGLQDADEVADVNVGLVLPAFFGRELAFVALFCQFVNPRLRHRVGLQFGQRFGALGRKAAAQWIQQPGYAPWGIPPTGGVKAHTLA